MALLSSVSSLVPAFIAVYALWSNQAVQPLVRCEVAAVTCQCAASSGGALQFLLAFFSGAVVGALGLFCWVRAQWTQTVSKRIPRRPRGEIVITEEWD